jgi:hypothetical protein
MGPTFAAVSDAVTRFPRRYGRVQTRAYRAFGEADAESLVDRMTKIALCA